MSEQKQPTGTPQNKAPAAPPKRGNGRPGGPAGRMMPGEKAQDFKGTMKKLLSYLGKFKLAIFAVMIFSVLSTLFNILGPKILGQATTKLFEGVMAMIAGTGGIDFAAVAQILLFLAAIYLLSSILRYGQNFIMAGVNTRITYNMRRDIAAKINRIPLKYYDTTTHGEVLSRMTNDVSTVSDSLDQSLTEMISSATTIVGVLAMMLSISWEMTLIALLIIPCSLVVVRLVVKHSQKYFRSQQAYLGHVNGHIEEMYGGHTVVKAFNGEERSIAAFEDFNDNLYQSAWKSQFLSGMMMPIMKFIGNIGYVAVCIVGSAFAAVGRITVGDIQAFIQYVRNFTQPITQVANVSNVLQQTAAAAERVFEFLDQDEESPDTESPIDPETVHGDVEFRHVRFGYEPEKLIIKDFSALVKQGQKVAIVGPTGAGKTTIVKLLMRFYDVTDGAILIDGEDIRHFTRNGLRSCFGMVLQDTWLYNASIADNIRYSRLDATDEEVRQAAWAAQAHRFIKTLPGGYDMVINEDASNISQGQKQLLTIARAILSDPKILILDEATSSVDTRTEIHIQQAMNTLMEGRTSFVIAHRLSTIRDADVILVMREGDIVEVGNHEELLAKGGFYSELYQSQFEPEDADAV